ncbi:MAG: histidine phosphatase family protein [Flavobacteriales bacterium]|nr:histidine phosphatase family protein [Flavobacteriales bacterium]
MKTLYLCRHAKSDRSVPTLDDFDRPLNTRGERNAPFMARVFKERGEPVDLLVSSPANRAITTARAFAQAMDIAEKDILQDRSIYLADHRVLLHVVNVLPPTADRVMLFGHNPGFTELVEYLSSEDIGNLPTCGIVRIDFPVKEWAAVTRDLGTLVWFDHPKRHQGQS